MQTTIGSEDKAMRTATGSREILNPSIGPTCRVTDEGEHGMATITPPFMNPKKAVDTTTKSV